MVPFFKQFADRVFLSSPLPEPAEYDARESLTYGQVYDKANVYGAWMRSLGVGYNDRVAIGGVNQSGWVISWLAALLIGAVPVLLNATL